MPPTTETETRVELCRIDVTPDIASALRQISDATGAPMTWHRRQALEQYIERWKAEQVA